LQTIFSGIRTNAKESLNNIHSRRTGATIFVAPWAATEKNMASLAVQVN
jgi:hypothetical protein